MRTMVCKLHISLCYMGVTVSATRLFLGRGSCLFTGPSPLLHPTLLTVTKVKLGTTLSLKQVLRFSIGPDSSLDRISIGQLPNLRFMKPNALVWFYQSCSESAFWISLVCKDQGCLNMAVFWDVSTYSLLDSNRRFTGAYYCYAQHPDDGGSRVLWNVS